MNDVDDMQGAGVRRAYWVSVVVASVALAASLWSWGVPLSNDGPTQVLNAWVHSHPERYAGVWTPRTPITSRGFLEVQQLLEPLLGWRDAWRTYVVLIAELWALGYLAFVSALAPRRRLLGLLGFAFVLHPNLYMGFMAFTCASAGVWWALALWLRAESRARGPTAIEHVLLALLLFVSACVHVVPAALGGVFLVAITLARPRPQPSSKVARVAFLALAGAPAGVIAILASGTDTGAPIEEAAGNLFDRLWNVGATFPGGPAWRIALAFALAALGIVGVVRRARSVDGARVEQALALLAIVLVCVSWAAPRDFAGWQYAGGRFAPLGLAVLCALALAPALHSSTSARMDRVLTRVTAALAAAFVVGTLAWSFSLHATLRARNAPAMAALDAVEALDTAERARSADIKSWTMIALDPRAGELPMIGQMPLFHLHQLFAVVAGGFATDAHDRVPTVHPLRRVVPRGGEPFAMIRDDVDPVRHADILRRQLSYAAVHDGLVLAGTAADHEIAIAAGFAPITRAPAPSPTDTWGVLVARFEGCSGRVRVAGGTGEHRVDVGWWPRRTPTVSLLVTLTAGESLEAPLPPLGCGEVWVTCKEGSAPARATFTRAGDNVLACDVGP